MIKIVFLDFDNTLYDHKSKSIPKSASDALNSIHKNGIKVYISTGRSLNELKKFDLSTLEYDGIISLNGQIIYDNKHNIIKSSPIQGALKEKLISLFKKKIVPMGIVTSDEIYLNYITEHVQKIQNSISTKCPSAHEYDGKDFYMVTSYVENKKMKEIIENLKDIANVTYWTDEGIDIIDKNISKASGVKEVLNYYHLSKDESMSFGDGENDIAMFEATGISIAMNNGNEMAKKKASYVTEDIDKNGIANAINKFIIIN